MTNFLRSRMEGWIERFWPALVIGAAWVWMFWPMMSGQTVVGYRDSASLYYPLFEWIDAHWAIGEIPLWNPFCNFGIPVVADGTSSVFYPGKLLFFLRFLSFPSRYGIYVAIHIPIAAAGVYWFARTLRANRSGATLAAFSFAFGGSVLFQVTNVIYLVSAAWLPFALCCVWKMARTDQWRWPMGAGVACALMILGGDPQMVYHVGLIAMASMGCGFLSRCGSGETKAMFRGLPFRWLVGAGARVGVMVVVTSLLSAVQLLPMYAWAQQSERAHPASIANIYMAANWQADEGDGDWSREVGQSLLGPPSGVMDHAYQFSQPPWSIAELIWPNVSGKPFPRNQRWTDALPGADRVWVPSLYIGILVFLLGVSGMRLWGRRQRQVWLTWLMVFFGVASLGWYGAVWLVNEICPSVAPWSMGPQVGGVYWLMNVLLPKYYVFRYPAKLFVVASLALSLLAGLKFKGCNLGFSRILFPMSVLVCGVGAVGLVFFKRAVLAEGAPVNVMFGPFDSVGATNGMLVSLCQPILVLGCVYAIWLSWNRSKVAPPAVWVAPLVVIVTILDVMFANRWLVPEVATSTFDSKTDVHRQIEQMRAKLTGDSPLRIYRSRVEQFEPEEWIVEGSDERLSEIIDWQRETLYPKHHLGEEVVLIGSFSSIWPKVDEDYLSAWQQYEGDLSRIATIADGAIIRMPGGTVQLVDLRGTSLERDERRDTSQVESYRSEFWIGAWISGVSWGVLLVIAGWIGLLNLGCFGENR